MAANDRKLPEIDADKISNNGGDNASRSFVAAAELFTNHELARVYTDILLNQPTTHTELADRLGLAGSTASKRISRLQELGIVDEGSNGRSKPLTTEPLAFAVRIGESTTVVTPTVIAAFGAREESDDIDVFLDRNGRAKLVEAVQYTLAYLDGDLTRRGVGRAMDIPPVEAIAITQALEAIIAIVQTVDASIPELEYEVSERKIEDAPYTVE